VDFKNPTENAIATWGISSANLPSDRQFHFHFYHYCNTDMDGLSESHQCRSVLILRRIYVRRIFLIMTGTILAYLDVKCRSVVCAYYCVSPSFESLPADRLSLLRSLVILSFYPGGYKINVVKQASTDIAFWFAADEKHGRLIASGHRKIWLELTECPHSSRMLRGLDW
jgi:hypothetical protein